MPNGANPQPEQKSALKTASDLQTIFNNLLARRSILNEPIYGPVQALYITLDKYTDSRQFWQDHGRPMKFLGMTCYTSFFNKETTRDQIRLCNAMQTNLLEYITAPPILFKNKTKKAKAEDYKQVVDYIKTVLSAQDIEDHISPSQNGILRGFLQWLVDSDHLQAKLSAHTQRNRHQPLSSSWPGLNQPARSRSHTSITAAGSSQPIAIPTKSQEEEFRSLSMGYDTPPTSTNS